jgi:hypothetical protein
MANEQLIEEVADKIEDVAVQVEEVADATRRLTGREVGFFAVGAGLGVACGFAVGYRIAEKRLKLKYEKLANEAAKEEVDLMRAHYLKKMQAARPKPPVDQIIVEVEKEERNEKGFTEAEQKAIDEANEKFPAEEEEAVVVEETTQVNVFEASEEWNYQYELAHRSKHVPYIIHIDEFTENLPEHDQTTYTYYEVDDVMADSRDTTIEDMDASIGLGNLGRWGHGSPDPNVVYVRNEVLGLDVEIVRDRGSWAETVRGTIRHSADRRRRPNRRFDDDDASR